MSSSTAGSSTAYQRVNKAGGLKFKGDKAPIRRIPTQTFQQKALGLEKGPGFKVKSEIRSDPLLTSSSSTTSTPTAVAAASTASTSSSVPVIHPPVVLAAGSGRSSWSLHKNELHEIDANLAALRDMDKQVERLEGTSKKELVAREKARIEEQVAMMVNTQELAPGIKFSVPNVANLNKEYLYRKEAVVSDATARLDARAKKKADRYCK